MGISLSAYFVSKTILIVDDNSTNRLLFGKIVSVMGHQSLESATGLDAVELTRLHRPDVILMDIGLPEISGLEITRQLKADPDLRVIPVIAVTAYATDSDKVAILAAGCDDYIPKPIQFPHFIETINRHLGIESAPEVDVA